LVAGLVCAWRGRIENREAKSAESTRERTEETDRTDRTEKPKDISVLDGVKYRIPEASTSYNVT
jgi:hypothetical protein